MPRYLIKFVSQLSHAEDLRSGKLFMRPASYYRDLERGQRIGQKDPFESAMSHQVAIYKNPRWAIYCMYTVKDERIDVRGNIHIPKQIIEDFSGTQGYAVVLDRDKFEKQLSTVKTNGYMLQAGQVNYHYITMEGTKQLLSSDEINPLALKHPYFSYQNEYRIIIANSVPDRQENIDYYFQSDLRDCSSIIPVSKMILSNDEYTISKREVNFNG